MTKQVDLNGYWLIEDNPVSKEGVFPYLGSQISSELEPNKIYMVYRPAEELENPETVESFNAVPFIDEHEMIGEGFTKYDDRPAGGVLYNVKADHGKLVGDFKIYSENLKDEIANGKKELSLGYLCDYELSRGVWNGQRYDAIQKNIRGNHVALVSKGRMGADVRVYDKAITMDSMPVDLEKEITKMAQDKDDDIEWITVKGNHIPIKKGQTKEQAVKEFIESKQKKNSISMPKTKYDDEIHKLEEEYMNVGKTSSSPTEALNRADELGKKINELKEKRREEWKSSSEGKKESAKEYKEGDIVKADSNFRGATEKIIEGKIIEKRRGLAGKEDANPPFEYKIKKEDGNTVWVNENAIKSKKEESSKKEGKDTGIPSGDGSPNESGANGSLKDKGVNKMADKKAMDADKREAIREVMAIANKPDSSFEGGEEEKIDTIAKLLEKSEYSKSETGTANDEDLDDEKKEAKDKCGKDEDEEEKKSEPEKKYEDEDDDEDEKKKEEEKKASEDSMPRQILKMIAKRDAIVKQVEPIIGSFACDEMTDVDAAVYACKKLGLQVSQDEALPCLRGFLAAHKGNKGNNKVYGLDSAISAENGVDKATQRYLKGE